MKATAKLVMTRDSKLWGLRAQQVGKSGDLYRMKLLESRGKRKAGEIVTVTGAQFFYEERKRK